MSSSDYRILSKAIGRPLLQQGTWTEREHCLSCSWGTSPRQLEDSAVANSKAKLTITPSQWSQKESNCQHG